MKLTQYLILVICIVLSGSNGAQEDKLFTQQVPSAEVNERMNLYKRIKMEQNKKALLQLLHDIADIQKQCLDKGYRCNVEGLSAIELPAIDLQRPALPSDDALPPPSLPRILAPKISLLGIVGNRARFRLEDGQIKDFSLQDFVSELWQLSEITPETALLIYKEPPKVEVRYQIDKRANINRIQQNENTSEHGP